MTLLQLSSKPVQQVSKYKLPGVMVNATLKFDDHIAAIHIESCKATLVSYETETCQSHQGGSYILIRGCRSTSVGHMSGLAHQPQ